MAAGGDGGIGLVDEVFIGPVLRFGEVMTSQAPTVFIGCASRARDVALAVQAALHDVAQCDVWDQDALTASATIIESLERAAAEYDFAVLVVDGDRPVAREDGHVGRNHGPPAAALEEQGGRDVAEPVGREVAAAPDHLVGGAAQRRAADDGRGRAAGAAAVRDRAGVALAHLDALHPGA
mgnify:CR=1 FL=1